MDRPGDAREACGSLVPPLRSSTFRGAVTIAELNRIAELANLRDIELSELVHVLERLPEQPHGRLVAAEQDVLSALRVGAVDTAPMRPVMAGALRHRQLEHTT